MKQDIRPINKRIATYRRLAGYTQQTAAEALGIKKNTYARMELHGKLTDDMIKLLADLYNVSSDLILYGSERGENLLINPEPAKINRLHEPPPIFAKEPELVLSTNEKNCIKVVREFTKDEQKQVIALINNIYKQRNGNG